MGLGCQLQDSRGHLAWPKPAAPFEIPSARRCRAVQLAHDTISGSAPERDSIAVRLSRVCGRREPLKLHRILERSVLAGTLSQQRRWLQQAVRLPQGVLQQRKWR